MPKLAIKRSLRDFAVSMKHLRSLLFVFLLISIFFFLTYKLTAVPSGLNPDESTIGYNAALISKSLHDENGAFLPIFILTFDGNDWKQPINIYAGALLFKLFGVSYFNLRLVSVLFVVISSFVFFKLLRLFFTETVSLIGLILYLVSPSILIQSHLVLENAALLPFILLWLYFLFSHTLKPSVWKLVISGIFLGISFYSYKGMHALAPTYFILSIFYLLYLQFSSKTKGFKPLLFFLLGSLPFFTTLPWVNSHYPWAIYESNVVYYRSAFDVANVYLSSFDFSFLFLKGDLMALHSTQKHGMFLAPTIILLFLGLFQLSQEKNRNYYFLFIVLLITPLPLTLVQSIYRASRLMVYIPLFTFIFTLGIKRILEIRMLPVRITILFILAVGLVGNYTNFLQYYYSDYPNKIKEDVSANFDQAMSEFRKSVDQTGETPYVETGMYFTYKADIQFFWESYFGDKQLRLWNRIDESFPDNALSLTTVEAYGDLINYKTIPSNKATQTMFYVLGK